jgi:excisionase family DNA binding protein
MAADYCGVSEKTIRNWIAEGKVRAEKSAGSFRIDREQLDALRREGPRSPHNAGRRSNGSAEDVRAESAPGPQALTVDDVLRLVRDAQADAIAKAEAAAMWQARAELLSQMLDESRERIRMLEAPKPHQSPITQNLGPIEPELPAEPSVPLSPAPMPPTSNGKVPWWRRWF